jgi:hypothetical protein
MQGGSWSAEHWRSSTRHNYAGPGQSTITMRCLGEKRQDVPLSMLNCSTTLCYLGFMVYSIAHLFDNFNQLMLKKRKRPPGGSRCKGSRAANLTSPTYCFVLDVGNNISAAVHFSTTLNDATGHFGTCFNEILFIKHAARSINETASDRIGWFRYSAAG